VILADLRNHGASPWSDDCSLEAMASDVLRLLDEVGASQGVLCGHSLGGKVAMTAALLAPERVSRLLIADIAPVVYDHSHESWRANLFIMDAMAAIPEAALGSRSDADAALAASVDDEGVRGFLLQNLMTDERRWRLNLHALRDAAHRGTYSGFPKDLPPAPASLPVRVVAGLRSNYCNAPEHRHAIERLFPGAEDKSATLDAGHWIHAEKPREFAALVDSFCADGENSVG
jgi:esterase